MILKLKNIMYLQKYIKLLDIIYIYNNNNNNIYNGKKYYRY